LPFNVGSGKILVVVLVSRRYSRGLLPSFFVDDDNNDEDVTAGVMTEGRTAGAADGEATNASTAVGLVEAITTTTTKGRIQCMINILTTYDTGNELRNRNLVYF
jgi:hypothetical protein